MDIKDLRREMDGVIQRMKGRLEREPTLNADWSKAFSLSLTKLQESRMWLGKCLEAEGHELPKEFADKYEDLGEPDCESKTDTVG